MRMRLMLVTNVLAAAIASAALAQGQAQPAPGDKPGAVVADVTVLKAKVDAVDTDKRLVTVTGPRGNTVTLKVGPAVKNLDQVKPGDQIVVRHLESVALFVRKSGEPPAAAEAATVQVAPKGAKPGAMAVDTVEVTGKVEAINYQKRTVTLKGPEGKTKTIKVGPSVKRFNEVKKGDEVVLRYTEAMAISVQKP